MKDLLDWVENAAQSNLSFRLQIAEQLAKDANTTMTIILAGLGATLAYAIKGFENATFSPVLIGATVLAVWLAGVGSMLTLKCLLTRPLSPPTNEPKNLYQKQFTLEALRETELKNIQQRIEEVTARNCHVAKWLDRARLAALASPIVFLAFASLAWLRV